MSAKNKGNLSVRRRVDVSDDTEFRRSYTINAYNAAAADEHENQTFEREKIRKMRLRRRKLLVGFLSLLIVVILGVIALSQYTAAISGIVAENQVTLNADDKARYIGAADDYFAMRPLERFSFFLNQAGFSRHMSETTPEIASADVGERSFMSAKLVLRARTPQAVWEVRGERQYVDADGAVFSRNLLMDPVVTIVDESGFGTEEGDMISTRLLRFVGQVVAGIEQDGTETVSRVTIPATALRFVEFWLDGRNYPIRAQIDRDSVSQAGDILNMLRHLDGQGIVPSYVDNRVEGKGFWR